jgi:hypothetical protein
LLALSGLLVCGVAAADFKEYTLTDGTVIKGEPIAPFSAKDVLFRLESGGYAPRVAWQKLSQESLKELAKNPKARPFVQLLIDEPPPELDTVDAPRPKKAPIRVNEVEGRPERPNPKSDFFAGIGTPLGGLLFLLMIGANLYAAYEVALFRNRPARLVCGVSAVAPVIGQLVFLCLPKVSRTSSEPVFHETAAEMFVKPTAEETAAAEAEAAAAAAAAAHASQRLPDPVIFRRGEVTINRRFLETKFSGFFRLVPGPAEKDLRLHFTTDRGEFVTRRISKATPTEATIIVEKEGATAEEPLPYNEIMEIQIRHKDLPV